MDGSYALRLKQAAQYSGIPEPTLRDWIRRGDLAACVYGGGAHKRRYVVRREDLEAAIDRHRQPASWEQAEA